MRTKHIVIPSWLISNCLKQNDQDWTNAVVSGSKEALEAYLQKYPNSLHKQEVLIKIDSIDWNVAKNADTARSLPGISDAHTDGSHIEEAENAMKKVKSSDLQPEEKAYGKRICSVISSRASIPAMRMD